MKSGARLAVFAGLAAVLAAAVLYGMSGRNVQETAGNPSQGRPPPAVLNRWKAADPKAEAPAGHFTDGRGRERTLSDFKGKYLLVNLWATWCGPCVVELPELAHAQEALKGDNIVVLAVDQEKLGPEKIADFLKAKDAAALDVYVDPAMALMSGFNAVGDDGKPHSVFDLGLPFTALIDPDGRPIAVVAGPQTWDDPAAIAYLKSVAARK